MIPDTFYKITELVRKVYEEKTDAFRLIGNLIRMQGLVEGLLKKIRAGICRLS